MGAVTATGGEALTARRESYPMDAGGPSGGLPGGRVLPSGAVTARSEAPASFRSSAVRPWIRWASSPTASARSLSRRRLIAYMVRADLKKTGADTLLGNVWWVVDPLLQMLIYSVLVDAHLRPRTSRTTALFMFSAILPWKWFEATVKDGVLGDHGAGAADQADLLPEARPAAVAP